MHAALAVAAREEEDPIARVRARILRLRERVKTQPQPAARRRSARRIAADLARIAPPTHFVHDVISDGPETEDLFGELVDAVHGETAGRSRLTPREWIDLEQQIVAALPDHAQDLWARFCDASTELRMVGQQACYELGLARAGRAERRAGQ